MIDLELVKESDLQSLTIIQKRLIELGLDDSKVMGHYLKITQIKSKLLSLEFSKLSRILNSYRKISDKLVSNIANGLSNDTPLEALKSISESLIDYSSDVESLLLDSGYDSELLDSVRAIESRLIGLENAQNT